MAISLPLTDSQPGASVNYSYSGTPGPRTELGPDRRPEAAKGQVLPKPKFGDACNSCGACCLAGPCVAADQFFSAAASKEAGRCPAIEKQPDGRFLCGLQRDPAAYVTGGMPDGKAAMLRRYVAVVVGTGRGCTITYGGAERKQWRESLQTTAVAKNAKLRMKEAKRLAMMLRRYLPFYKDAEGVCV